MSRSCEAIRAATLTGTVYSIRAALTQVGGTFPAANDREFPVHKVYTSAAEAVSQIRDGASIAVAGFGTTGAPFRLMQALCETSVRDVELISNNGGLYDWALGRLLDEGRVRRVVATHIGGNKNLEAAFRRGEVEVELVPQGTFVERLRAGGAGIAAFFTPSGVDTLLELGMPLRYNPDGSIAVTSQGKERRTFDGRPYILETSIRPDVALVRAQYGDTAGNLVYNESARNFNPAMATAAKFTIAEVEHLVQPGELDPNHIHTPGIFVNALVEVGVEGKWHERLMTRDNDGSAVKPVDAAAEIRHFIAQRAARDLNAGEYVNLGTGIPTLVPHYLGGDSGVWIQSENGIVGLGPAPLPGRASFDLTNASKESATLLPGGSISDSATSFSMIRGGHIDVSILGAMQVSATGDLANWVVPGRSVAGMGGAMDLAVGARRVVVTTLHTDVDGRSKIVRDCTFPITGRRVVDRIITDLAVIDVTPGGLVLREIAPHVTVEQVLSATDAPLTVPQRLDRMPSLT